MNRRLVRTASRGGESTDLNNRLFEVHFQTKSELLSPIHKILAFVVVPSLVMWSIVWLAVSGQYLTAVAVSAIAVASGIVGWCLATITP